MPGSVIVGGARTPIGKLSGALRDFTAMELGGATAYDALFCTFDHRGMGASTDAYSAAEHLTRAEQDDYAAMSHERATTTRKMGLFDDEMAPVSVPQRKGDPLLVTDDEGVRPAPPPRASPRCARRSPPTAR